MNVRREHEAHNQLPHSEADPPGVLEAKLEHFTKDLKAHITATIRDTLAKRAAPNPLLTVEEAAGVVGISKRSMETLIGAGEIRVMDVGPNGGLRRIHPDALKAYMRNCTRRRAGR